MLSSAIKKIIMKPMKTKTTFETSTTRVELNLISDLRLSTMLVTTRLSTWWKYFFIFSKLFNFKTKSLFTPVGFFTPVYPISNLYHERLLKNKNTGYTTLLNC